MIAWQKHTMRNKDIGFFRDHLTFVIDMKLKISLLSIVFATKNRHDYLKRTIASIDKELNGVFNYEIVIVDGNSTDGSIQYLQSHPKVRLYQEDKPRGCCYAFNQAFRLASGDWVCWLNDDVEIYPGSFMNIMKFLLNPANSRVGMGAFTSSRNQKNIYDFVLNSCMRVPIPYANFGIIRKELLEQIGYLDLNYKKYGWDPDLAMKVWDAGFTVEACPNAHIIHYFAEDILRKKDEICRNPDCDYLLKKWEDKVEKIAWNIKLENYETIWNELDTRMQMRFLVHQGRLEEAERKVLKDLKDDPKALLYFYLAGIEIEKKGDYENASTIYQRIIHHIQDRDVELAAWANFKFGEHLYRLKKPQEAKKYWKKTLRLNPDHVKAKILLNKDYPLKIVMSLDKRLLDGHIWVPMDPTNKELWEYYFSKCKISSLVLFINQESTLLSIERIGSTISDHVTVDCSILIFTNEQISNLKDMEKKIRSHFSHSLTITFSTIEEFF